MSDVIKTYDGWADGGFYGRFTTNAAYTLGPILNTIFVDGYNTRVVSGITRITSTTAEATTTTDHGYQTGQVILMAGATQTQYNGEFRITVVSPTKFQYEVTGTPTTPATTGTAFSSKVASLGWTNPFTPVSPVTVLRSANGASSQFYFRVDDPASKTITRSHIGGVVSLTNQFVTEFQLYESMSDLNTGTTTGFMMLTRGAANGGAVANLIVHVIGDDKSAWILTQLPGGQTYSATFIGDFRSDVPGEAKPACVVGKYGQQSQNDTNATQNGSISSATYLGAASFGTNPSGIMFGRNPFGTGTNQTGRLIFPYSAGQALGNASQNNNDPANMVPAGSIFPHPVYCQSDLVPAETRGRIPGVYQCFRGSAHPYGYEDVKNVWVDGAFRTLRIFNIFGSSSTTWFSLAIDITGPWA